MTTYSMPPDVRPTIDTLHQLRAQIRAELRDPGPYTLVVTPGQWHDLEREIERDAWWYDRRYIDGRRREELRVMDFTIVIPTEIRPRGQRIRGREIDYSDLEAARIPVFDRLLDQIQASYLSEDPFRLQPASRPAPKTTHANWGA